MKHRKIDLTPGKFCKDVKERIYYICKESDLGENIPEGYTALARYIQQVSTDDLRVFLYFIRNEDIGFSAALPTDITCYDTTRKKRLDPFYGNVSERIQARRIYHTIKKAEQELAQTK
ncbi:hypothetical protein J4402_00930 [Candidatus Pacearchaeota archaeon]|nr:hypothetical protein [Candidatus Pacearchaeota archaeon]